MLAIELFCTNDLLKEDETTVLVYDQIITHDRLKHTTWLQESINQKFETKKGLQLSEDLRCLFRFIS